MDKGGQTVFLRFEGCVVGKVEGISVLVIHGLLVDVDGVDVVVVVVGC